MTEENTPEEQSTVVPRIWYLPWGDWICERPENDPDTSLELINLRSGLEWGNKEGTSFRQAIELVPLRDTPSIVQSLHHLIDTEIANRDTKIRDLEARYKQVHRAYCEVFGWWENEVKSRPRCSECNHELKVHGEKCPVEILQPDGSVGPTCECTHLEPTVFDPEMRVQELELELSNIQGEVEQARQVMIKKNKRIDDQYDHIRALEAELWKRDHPEEEQPWVPRPGEDVEARRGSTWWFANYRGKVLLEDGTETGKHCVFWITQPGENPVEPRGRFSGSEWVTLDQIRPLTPGTQNALRCTLEDTDAETP